MRKDREEQGSRRGFLQSAFAVCVTAGTAVIPIDRIQAAPHEKLPTGYAAYIALQMRMWQESHRKNDASQQMTNISKRLSAQDIQAIGLYFERSSQTDFAKNSRHP